MPGYVSYGKKKTQPNRKTRKGVRNSAFIANKVAARKARALKREGSSNES